MIKELKNIGKLTFDNELIKLIGGHIFFQTVNTAVKFKLFDLLEHKGNLTASQIASHLNIQARPARILLLGLTSLKLLEKNFEEYSNTKLATQYFTSNSPENLIAVMEWQAEINYHALGHLHESMISGKNEGLIEFSGTAPTLYERLAQQPHLEKIFQDAMEDISKQANIDLSNYVDFSNTKCLVDVGGGNGSNIICLAKKYKNLKAIVFDRATVCEIAQKNIAANHLQERCSTVTGDCFKTEFPSEADAIIFCHFMTIWTEEKDQFLLNKAYQALPKGGKVYLFNMMQNNTEDGPLSAAMGSPYFLALATAEGMLYTWDEHVERMKIAGFKNIEVIKLPRDHGVIVGTKI
jgi:ubiquinone/menaquinone biosynthesis C-methylase UbiE